MPKKPEKFAPLGNRYGKPDVERLGLFIEMPYIAVRGRPGKDKEKKQEKKPNCLGYGPKILTGLSDALFDKGTLKRVFIGESIKGRGRKPKPPGKPISERPLMPPDGHKWHSTPGDYYGTFSGVIKAFSAEMKKRGKHVPEKPNMLTRPIKEGGPGYVDICLSKYPVHKDDPFRPKPKYKEYGKLLDGPLRTVHFPQPFFDVNPFRDPPKYKSGPTYVPPKDKPFKVIGTGIMIPAGPGKWDGGMHAGTFSKFPSYTPSSPYMSQYDALHQKKAKGKKGEKDDGKIFMPQSYAMKSYYNTSVLNQNVDFRLNNDNFNTFEPTFVKYLIKNKE